MAPKSTRTLLIIAGIIVVAAGSYFFWSKNDANTPLSTSEAPGISAGFVKEGQVSFYKKDSQQPIKTIDVEIADNDAERTKGLMYRSTMPDSVGMLFIFEQSEPQAFWMKNTIISLDIIYVNEKKQIVSIQKNAKPYSEESLPSKGNAQYVVEVNGGWCDKYGVQEGDIVKF